MIKELIKAREKQAAIWLQSLSSYMRLTNSKHVFNLDFMTAVTVSFIMISV